MGFLASVVKGNTSIATRVHTVEAFRKVNYSGGDYI
jgi:hypothetical protein